MSLRIPYITRSLIILSHIVVYTLSLLLRHFDVFTTREMQIGVVASMIIWSLTMFIKSSRIVKVFGVLVCSIMVYTLIDHLFYVHKHFDSVDARWLYVCFGLFITTGLIANANKRLTADHRDIFQILLCCTSAGIILLSRNYEQVHSNYLNLYESLNIPYDQKGYPYYLGHAVASFFAAMYCMVSSINRRAEHIISWFFVTLTISWYINITSFSPYKITVSEVIIFFYLIIWLAIGLLRYKFRNNKSIKRKIGEWTLRVNLYLVAFLISSIVTLAYHLGFIGLIVGGLVLWILIEMLLSRYFRTI